MKHLSLLTFSLYLLTFSLSAVPIRWTVETSCVQPARFDGYHGETIELAATMQSYGKPLAITNDLIGIYWQTNGMGSAYWTAPATLSNNVMTARWTPSMDVGANSYQCFIGTPGEIYRAAFQLRLRPSPGAVPSELPLPVKALDFAQIQVINPPYYTRGETDARIIELAPAPGNYDTVSNRAMTAVQPAAIVDMETQTHAAATYQPIGNYLTTESDPSVADWAKKPNPAPVTDLSPAIAYTTAVSNKLETASIAATNYTDAAITAAHPVPYKMDRAGNYTAVTIGDRTIGTLVGKGSLAQGSALSSSGNYSHAEGSSTQAVGSYSHAEGYSTYASGSYSHAEGGYTQALGTSTHAEGYSTHAEGGYTHAEGGYTRAEGSYTHAEGSSTHAEGDYTHAEGGSTHAEGSYTHAEGYYTHASGGYSHAEGGYTTAGKSSGNKGRYAHAAGFNAYATNTTAFTWNGSAKDNPSTSSGSDYVPPYGDHGNGTYNINPAGGLSGFWIGETNMADHIRSIASGGSAAERRIAMFIIEMNDVPSTGSVGTDWVGFELKASTNNFPEQVAPQFYGQSGIVGDSMDETDEMMIYRLYPEDGGTSGRPYTRVRNTSDSHTDGIHPDRYVILVDVSCLTRGHGTDWLSEDNPDLVWCYSRFKRTSEESVSGDRLWHPIAPVRWFSTTPNWAN